MWDIRPSLDRWHNEWKTSARFRQTVLKTSVGVIILLGLWFVGRSAVDRSMPDFREFDRVAEKKEAFFGYLLPLVEEINQGISADRERLEGLRDQLAAGSSPGFLDSRWINDLAVAYRFESPEPDSLAFLNELLRRVDAIPPSLVLAQAAHESAWGTSRFARQGNNFFGQRDYRGGGMVPRRRAAGAKWTVATYDHPRASIEAYVHNLNTHDRYRRLRRIRREVRRRDDPLLGSALAPGLLAYSEQGSRYIRLIQSMIRSNDLTRYDT